MLNHRVALNSVSGKPAVLPLIKVQFGQSKPYERDIKDVFVHSEPIRQATFTAPAKNKANLFDLAGFADWEAVSKEQSLGKSFGECFKRSEGL